MNKTPQQVIDDIIADWKSSQISFEEASRRLNYSSKQSLSTLFYRLKKNNEYFTLKLAAKFGNEFNYDPEFLMSGLGRLNNSYTLGQSEIDQLQFLKTKYTAMLNVASFLIKSSNDNLINKAWESICREDESSFKTALVGIFHERGIMINEGDIQHLAAHVACIKDINQFIQEFGYLDAPSMNGSSFPFGITTLDHESDSGNT